jgi:AcrR family transcriptional regulator
VALVEREVDDAVGLADHRARAVKIVQIATPQRRSAATAPARSPEFCCSLLIASIAAPLISVAAFGILRSMPRWEPDAVGRLQGAAVEMFAAQGFEGTTVAQIAERAGLTERTFFNHFANKRDVLFGPTTVRQREIVVREIAACGHEVAPLDAVIYALQAAADEILEELHGASIRRREIIDSTPELMEREDGKRSELTAVIAKALCARGVEQNLALLTARAGALLEQTAEQRWSQPAETRTLRDLLSDALLSLRAVVS